MAVAVLCDLGLEVNIKVWNVLLDQGVQLQGEEDDDDDDDHGDHDDADDHDHLCSWIRMSSWKEKMMMMIMMSHH